jgi:ech hydrogenase subunit A
LLLGDHPEKRPHAEQQPALIRFPLLVLGGAVLVFSMAAPLLSMDLTIQVLTRSEPPSLTWTWAELSGRGGTFGLYLIFLGMGAGLFAALVSMNRDRSVHRCGPYMSGVQAEREGFYLGPMNKPVSVIMGNNYFPSLFGERRLTTVVNALAAAILAYMCGGTLL